MVSGKEEQTGAIRFVIVTGKLDHSGYPAKIMDQAEREKITEKLKKIKALAERGVGGEKDTAMKIYEDLKARYELEDEEIMQDEVTIHWFGYANELEEELLKWIFYKVTGDKANISVERNVAANARKSKQQKSYYCLVFTERN